MKWLWFVAVLVISGLLYAGEGGNQSGRGAGYRSDYSAGRSPTEARAKDHPQNTFFVNRVVDGDTVRLREGEKVRLIGVDTPETKHPTKPVQYFGKEASAFTQREIERRSVVLDYEANKRDKYGRLLAYIHRVPDQFFLNAEIVKQGYGFAYTRFPFKYMDEFRRYEKQARDEGLGLWQREKKDAPATPPVKDKPGVEDLAVNKAEPAKAAVPLIKSADQPRAVVVESEPVAAKKEGTVLADCKIKGNINAKGEKIYHAPGGRWYDKTKIEEDAGERWFCTEEEAVQAGWRKAGA